MVERLAAILGGLDEDTEVLDHLALSAEVGEGQWAQGVLKIALCVG